MFTAKLPNTFKTHKSNMSFEMKICVDCKQNLPIDSYWDDLDVCHHCNKIRRSETMNEYLEKTFNSEDLAPLMLTCTTCKIEKDSSEFYKNHHYKTGYQPWCKPCRKLRYAKSKASDKNEITVVEDVYDFES